MTHPPIEFRSNPDCGARTKGGHRCDYADGHQGPCWSADDPQPDTSQLLAVMREVRDSSSYLLNPHERTCIGGGRDGVCNCSRARRHTAAWRAFHDALAASGVPSLAAIEAAT